MEEGDVAPPSVPALPDLVLRCILGHLPMSDLIPCRLVNKAWNHAAVFVLNQKMKIYIKSSECITKYCGTFANSIEGVSLKIRSLHFDEELFEEIVDGINDGAGGLIQLVLDLQKLAEIAGEQVKELTVYLEIEIWKLLKTTGTRNEVCTIICQILFVHYTEVEKLKLALSFLCDDDARTDCEDEVDKEIGTKGLILPKLNILTINYYEDSKGILQRPVLRAFKRLSKSLLSSAINLETLFCEYDYVHYVTDDILHISPQLHTLHLRHYKKLFNGETQFATERVTALIHHRFPQLSALHVEYVKWTSANDEIFKCFLRNHADTLYSMCLYSNGDHLLTFPSPDITLKTLKKLELSTFKGKILWENLPAVNELGFYNADVNSDNLHSSTLPSDWPVTKFTYRVSRENTPNLEAIYPSLAFPLFPLWFSKLSSLHLNFKMQQKLIDVIPQIFNCCRQLKALAIRSSVHMELDECITGIPYSELAILKEKCPACNGNAASMAISTENIMKMIEVAKSSRSSALSIANLSGAFFVWLILGCCHLIWNYLLYKTKELEIRSIRADYYYKMDCQVLPARHDESVCEVE